MQKLLMAKQMIFSSPDMLPPLLELVASITVTQTW
jgi:hypothetical protein